MELMTRHGFKQSEAGLIPIEWSTEQIDTLVENGGLIRGPFGGALKKEFFVRNGYKVYEQKNAIYSSVELGEYYIDEAKFKELKRFEIHEEDFILSCSGTIGRIYQIPSRFEKGIINQALLIIRLNQKKAYPKYFYYQFVSDYIQNKVIDDTQGGAMKNLVGMSEFRKALIPFPPTLTEQKAIATALSDVDALISSLERLITKKKAIKQGAMQELLTPKDGWKKTSLVELAESKKSNFDDGDWIESEYIIDAGIRLIQTGNIGVGKFIEKGSKKYISEESFVKLKCKEVLKGDLLVCRLAEPAGRACVMPNIGESKVITSVDVSIFRGDTKLVNREFLSQYFTTNSWFSQVVERVGGTTHKRISRGALGRIEFLIPSIEEQKAIAQILSDMDMEIEALEAKKAKYQGIKQGMMQELLTGKTRLV